MRPFDELVLTLTLGRIKARERLEDPLISGGLSMEAFYDLCIAAGYSAEVSQKAANQRGWERLQAGVIM